MALTRMFENAVKMRTEQDPAFRDDLLREAVEQLIAATFKISTTASLN